jgi:hypothetical protein
MGHFFASKKEHEIEVVDIDGNKGTVWIRELTEDDENKKLAKTVKFNMKGDANSARLDLAASRQYDLVRCISRWDFTDEEGTEVPVNEANIKELHPYTSGQIRKKIDELNKLPEDREEARIAAAEGDDEDDEGEILDEDASEDEDEEGGELISLGREHPTTGG